MRIKYFIPVFLTTAFCAIWYFQLESNQSVQRPQPTNGETIVKEGAEEGDNQAKREAWFDLMHQAAPGTNWKSIEYHTSMERHQKRVRESALAQSRGDDEILANNNLTGQWYERGSRNQSGSVFVTEYIPQTEAIYLISAGGSLFKGTRSGNDWEVINQDLRFEVNFLRRIEMDGQERFLASINDQPHYSDDGGYTWTASTGIPVEASNASTKDPVVLENVDNHIYILAKKDYWDNYKLYQSIDNGESYQSIHTFDSNNSNQYNMVQPHHSNDVYLIEKNGGFSTRFYKLNQNTNSLDLLLQNDNFGFGESGRANLAATMYNDTTVRFYAYHYNNAIYDSEDFGSTWNLKDTIPARPWSVGVYVSPSDPDFLVSGAVECYKSYSGGSGWIKINDWWDYYGDENGSLHADMMTFSEYETPEGDPFYLSSNHGGLNISYNEYSTVENLSLNNLNVSQYYDVATDPTDPAFIYAGSQDQGFQRAIAFEFDSPVDFDQVISGDYGHIVFSENEQRMWTVYPGGWVTYYPFPQTSGLSESYDLESDDETVWIPPLMSSPDPNENAIYMAGGNITGDEGSYLIKLTLTDSIFPSQIDYDFKDNSAGGTISIMRTSSVDPDHWFVSTTNGRFFYSYDSGSTWDQSTNFIPGGHYLYGAAILPSKLSAATVYLGGSGYSNPAVYKSTDGGQNFSPMVNGLPETLVFELAANEDESLIFAATEAGPYVYVAEDDQWYDMSGIAAPSQTYWSVEYLEESQTVRFGTYGRGIWDFKITEVVSNNEITVSNQAIKIVPNPTSDLVRINLTQTRADQLTLRVSTIAGQQVLSNQFEVIKGQSFQTELSLKSLPKGTYIISLDEGSHISSQQVILQ